MNDAAPLIANGLPPGSMLYSSTRHRPRHISVEDVVGFLPDFLDPLDPRPAATQIDDNYQHGGGWRPIPKFTFDRLTGALQYPGDPVMYPWVATSLRDELILIYAAGLTLIGQPDGSFAVSRLD